MENKYEAVMEYVKVTDEMQERIMNTLKQVGRSQMPGQQTTLIVLRRYMGVAACLLLFMAGAISLPRFMTAQNNPQIQVIPQITEHGSLAELSAAVGFDIQDLTTVLPFRPKTVRYTSYWGTMAEVEYAAENKTAVYRKGNGEDDVSGDYQVYDTIQEVSVQDVMVTLKGNGDSYQLATWNTSGYSYSLSLSEAVAEEILVQMIECTLQ